MRRTDGWAVRLVIREFEPFAVAVENLSMSRKLVPLLDRILVSRVAAPSTSAGGVLLPESAVNKVRDTIAATMEQILLRRFGTTQFLVMVAQTHSRPFAGNVFMHGRPEQINVRAKTKRPSVEGRVR